SAINAIHGRDGSVVTLSVRHSGKVRSVRLKRGNIPPVTAYGWLAPHHIGVVTATSFGSSTSADVARAISYVRSIGATRLILDLRDNPGGYVDSAQAVVSQFITHGVVAYEESPHKSLTPLNLVKTAHVTHLPMVVLVNGGTASAAEITAAALRDHHRAILIGTTTYGKGSMQSIYSLPDGSTIRITDRLWLTPDKKSVQKRGLKPNIVVRTVNEGPFTDDAQLAAAERYLLSHGH
ncbi:MAG TPA: S41 family peptidase, partial [Chloroflexota bacterium]|nr:S41 family peptidase [Chloroflexota bacterium]